jgi:hypothetical protein
LTQSSDELTSASNQIVKDLRDRSRDPRFLGRKRPNRPPGLESRFGASGTKNNAPLEPEF